MKKLLLSIVNRLLDNYFIYKKNQKIKSIGSLGKEVYIQEPFYFTGCNNIKIGNNVSIAAFVHIWGGGITIGDNVLIASHTAITSITHNPKNEIFNSENILKKVIIGNNVCDWAHSVIFPGITIGNNCIIGAGSILNEDVPDNSVYAGVPAKELYKINKK